MNTAAERFVGSRLIRIAKGLSDPAEPPITTTSRRIALPYSACNAPAGHVGFLKTRPSFRAKHSTNFGSCHSERSAVGAKSKNPDNARVAPQPSKPFQPRTHSQLPDSQLETERNPPHALHWPACVRPSSSCYSQRSPSPNPPPHAPKTSAPSPATSPAP